MRRIPPNCRSESDSPSSINARMVVRNGERRKSDDEVLISRCLTPRVTPMKANAARIDTRKESMSIGTVTLAHEEVNRIGAESIPATSAMAMEKSIACTCVSVFFSTIAERELKNAHSTAYPNQVIDLSVARGTPCNEDNL